MELLFGLGGICPLGGPEYPPDTRVFKMTRQLGLRVSDKMAQSRYFLRMLQQLPWVPKADPVESELAVASAGADADAAKLKAVSSETAKLEAELEELKALLTCPKIECWADEPESPPCDDKKPIESPLCDDGWTVVSSRP